MRLTAASFLLAASLAIPSVAAHADTFTSSFSGGATGSITLTLSSGCLATAGPCLATGGSGTVEQTPVTLVTSPDPGFDNLIYAASPFIDNDGLEFTDTFGDTYGFYSYDPNYPNPGVGYALFEVIDGTYVDPNVSFGSAPEPSSLILLGTGLLAAAGGVRRRFTRS